MITSSKVPPVSGKIKILLVDDHPVVRQGIRTELETAGDMVVCGEAGSAAETLALMPVAKPHVALVDLCLGTSSGLDLIKDLHIRWPKVAVLVVSMRDEGVYAERSLRAGAQGYIVKTEAVGEIAHAVREVLKGNLFLSRSMANKMLCKFVEGKSATERSVVECLTNRELQVLELLGGGLATWQVAQQLHVSTKTVATYRENIKRKMHLDDATDLLRFAIQWVHCPNENELRA